MLNTIREVNTINEVSNEVSNERKQNELDYYLDNLLDRLDQVILDLNRLDELKIPVENIVDEIKYVQDGLYLMGIALDSGNFSYSDIRKAIRNIDITINNNRHIFSKFDYFLTLYIKFVKYVGSILNRPAQAA